MKKIMFWIVALVSAVVSVHFAVQQQYLYAGLFAVCALLNIRMACMKKNQDRDT